MFIKGLDHIDQQILEILEKNARASYIDIAKKVNLSHVAVKNRILSLEKKGVIDGYTIIVNPHKMTNHTTVYMEITVEAQSLYQVIDTLKADENITQVYLLSGGSKLHVHGLFDGEDSLARFLRENIYTLPGLLHVETSVIISRCKDVRNIRL